MGMIIDDDDFFNVVLASLPESYNTVMSAVITSAATARCTLSPADLSSIIKSEYDYRKIRHSGNTSNQPNKALANNYHSNCRTFKSGSAPNKNINCKNCKKVGHTKADCWAKGGDKEGQWLQTWQGKCGGKQRAKPSNYNTNAAQAADDAFTYTTSFNQKELTSKNMATDDTIIEVWDSATSDHISPYRDQFTSLEIFHKPRNI
jgi:hypothetical protein